MSADPRLLEQSLTPTEYGILAVLAQHAGQVLTHEQILKAVWGDTYGAENNYLWVPRTCGRRSRTTLSSRATSSPSAASATGW